jgi:hypothetical protein
MGARAHIPLVFHVTDQVALKRDLERFANGVSDYVQRCTEGVCGAVATKQSGSACLR